MKCSLDCFNCEHSDCIKPESFSIVKSLNNKRYYQRHKETENARSKEYAKNHREQINANKRRNYNKDKRHKAYLKLKAKRLKESGNVPDYNIFGNNLKRILKEKHMTQLELSLVTGVSQGSISGYCRSINYPPVNIAQDLAEGLSVDVAELFKIRES